jgi:hypothetical protein
MSSTFYKLRTFLHKYGRMLIPKLPKVSNEQCLSYCMTFLLAYISWTVWGVPLCYFHTCIKYTLIIFTSSITISYPPSLILKVFLIIFWNRLYYDFLYRYIMYVNHILTSHPCFLFSPSYLSLVLPQNSFPFIFMSLFFFFSLDSAYERTHVEFVSLSLAYFA